MLRSEREEVQQMASEIAQQIVAEAIGQISVELAEVKRQIVEMATSAIASSTKKKTSSE